MNSSAWYFSFIQYTLPKMKINFERIVEHIHQGESLTVEFKECQNEISRDVYESVYA